jgi:hypothetical protein
MIIDRLLQQSQNWAMENQEIRGFHVSVFRFRSPLKFFLARDISGLKFGLDFLITDRRHQLFNAPINWMEGGTFALEQASVCDGMTPSSQLPELTNKEL